MNITFTNGSKIPVDPKFNPVCGFDSNGNPVPLMLTSGGAIAGNATEETLSDHRNKSLGLNGGRYVTGTGAQAGVFVAIQALEDTVIASMTSVSLAGTLTAIPLPAGVMIYGVITAFTLTSGKVIAYNA